MVPYYIIIALVITLLTVFKEYVIRTRIYDYAIYAAFILSWIGAMCPTKMFYIISGVVVVLLTGLSYKFWGKEVTQFPTNDNNITFEKSEIVGYDKDGQPIFPFMTGCVGKIVSEYNGGGYLGTTIKDGEPVEIIIYCEEELKSGDAFEIQGVCGTKIMAIKK